MGVGLRERQERKIFEGQVECHARKAKSRCGDAQVGALSTRSHVLGRRRREFFEASQLYAAAA